LSQIHLEVGVSDYRVYFNTKKRIAKRLEYIDIRNQILNCYILIVQRNEDLFRLKQFIVH